MLIKIQILPNRIINSRMGRELFPDEKAFISSVSMKGDRAFLFKFGN